MASDRQRQTGQAGPAAHIDHHGSAGEGILDDRTVEHVTIPEAGHLPRTDQSMAHPGVGENRHEGGGDRHTLTKDGSRTRRCGWRLERIGHDRPTQCFT